MKSFNLLLSSAAIATLIGCGAKPDSSSNNLVVDDGGTVTAPLRCYKKVSSDAIPSARVFTEATANRPVATPVRAVRSLRVVPPSIEKEAEARKVVLDFFYEVRKNEILHEQAYKMALRGTNLRKLDQVSVETLFKTGEELTRQEVRELESYIDRTGTPWTSVYETLYDLYEQAKKDGFTYPGMHDVRRQVLKAIFFCDISLN